MSVSVCVVCVSVCMCACVYVYGDLVCVRNAETSNKYMLYIADRKTSFLELSGREGGDRYI